VDFLALLLVAEAAVEEAVDVLLVGLGESAKQATAALGVGDVSVADVLGVACGAVDALGSAGGFASVLEVVGVGHGVTSLR
jgi:hypothetical protein